jgi:peptide/nickel transport system permease protein
MLRYAGYRLMVLLALLAGLSVVTFFYLQLVPGDPVAGMLGPSATPGLVKQLRHEFGLDQPLITQYWNWVTGLVHGNLGISFQSREPIAAIVGDRIVPTLHLTIASMVWIVVIGLPAGFLAGIYKDSWIDRVLSTSALVGLSAPVFWIGTILILVFSVGLHWLPSQGYVPLAQDPVASIQATLLPSLAIGLAMAPYLARMTRAATVEVQQEQFVEHAHAKGLRRATIVWRYSARNTILAVIVVLGLQFGRLLSGQVIIETLFSWPGVGRLAVDGAIQRDYFMVEAIILILAALYCLVNLAAELCQAWLDPRIRL